MSGDGASGTVSGHPLIGRDNDLAAIWSFVDRAAGGGGALMLSGDAGVGKTVLLHSAVALAAAAGSRVLRATGTEFEADLSFAGLNQLVHPLCADLSRLSDLHRRALSVALGLADGSPSDRLVLSNAVLELLVQAATTRPLLVIVDDVQWLDRASAAVLAFVARRLMGTRVGLLAAARTGEASFFERNGIAGRDIFPLDDIAAAALLNERFPALTPRVRQHLVAEAQGNPLALLELPAALGPSRAAPSGPLLAVLPLSRRLQSMFARRVENLPRATRDVLLIAVLDGTGDLGVLGSDDTGKANIDHLASAERARLVSVDARSRRVVFRHPLIRSAVVERSTVDERRRAHVAIAERRTNQPARQAWHLAEAAIGPDERVAAQLNVVAHENSRRGDALGAISALLRAAELSPDGGDRGERLAKAAYLGAIVTGDLQRVAELLDAAREADPEGGGALAGAIAGAYRLLNAEGDVDTAYRLLLGAIDTCPHASDARHQPLLEALYNLSMIGFFGGRPELWEQVHQAIDRLTPHPPELLVLLDKTCSDPARLALPIMDRLDIAIGELGREPSPALIARTSIAAAYVDRLPGCRSALLRVVYDGRDGGAITSAIEAIFLLCIDDFFSGTWDDLSQLSQEGLELCRDRDYRLLAWTGLFLQAMVAAARGDEPAAEQMADEMAGWAASRNIRAVSFYASHIRTLAALGRGDYENAYRHATAVSPAGVLASHVPHALWLVMDVVEAAVRTGRRHEAEAHVAAANEVRLSEISPRLALVIAGSAALCATDEDARAAFETALAVPAADRWPFDLARVELAYGERLRRLKATTDARRHLMAALEIFERLGARPWAARASGELRAAGGATDTHGGLRASALTPQQREIATLAASGLTNKQIGERLFLSHRTVGTHLYQLFPKLGITSRAALRDALAELEADE